MNIKLLRGHVKDHFIQLRVGERQLPLGFLNFDGLTELNLFGPFPDLLAFERHIVRIIGSIQQFN